MAIITVVALAVLGVAGTAIALALGQNHPSDTPDDSDNSGDQTPIGGNAPDKVPDFDLAFLENKATNQLYSPLSIKYALGMLEEGAAGDSRQQIEDVVGSLTPRKYPNNQNMSFANGMRFLSIMSCRTGQLRVPMLAPSVTGLVRRSGGCRLLRPTLLTLGSAIKPSD